MDPIWYQGRGEDLAQELKFAWDAQKNTKEKEDH
jgi:hypothetical protein